jgi:hypothetical protein
MGKNQVVSRKSVPEIKSEDVIPYDGRLPSIVEKCPFSLEELKRFIKMTPSEITEMDLQQVM